MKLIHNEADTILKYQLVYCLYFIDVGAIMAVIYSSWIYNNLYHYAKVAIAIARLSVTCDMSVVFPGYSSIKKTYHHDIIDILLKVALSTLTLIKS